MDSRAYPRDTDCLAPTATPSFTLTIFDGCAEPGKLAALRIAPAAAGSRQKHKGHHAYEKYAEV